MMKNDEESSRNRSRKRLESVTKAPRLGFFSRKKFSSLISRESLNTRRVEQFTLPFSPIYRRKEEGGCRPARPSEQGCFHKKARPSVGTFWKAQVGLVTICTPLFTKYTPFGVFFVMIPFRNVTKLYRLRNDIHFLSRML